MSRIFRNGETDAEFGVNDVNNDDVDICDGVVAGGGVDDEDRDVSKVADDWRLKKRFKNRRCFMLDGDMPRP